MVQNDVRLDFRRWLDEAFGDPSRPVPAMVARASVPPARGISNWVKAIDSALSWIGMRILPPPVMADAGMPPIGQDDPRSDRLQNPAVETLWSDGNHRLHRWLQRHRIQPLLSCQKCYDSLGRGHQATKAQFLGQGHYGKAYTFPPARLVFKVTTDQGEAAMSWKVLQAGLADSMVVDVCRIRGIVTSLGNSFGILSRLGNTNIPSDLAWAAQILRKFLVKHVKKDTSRFLGRGGEEVADDAMGSTSKHPWGDPVDGPAIKAQVKAWMMFLIEVVVRILGVTENIWLDPHMKNLVLDDQGNVRAIDLGYFVRTVAGEPLSVDDIPET
jgi:hypothetical protein